MRVIGSSGTEAAGMADNITIVALQLLRTPTPSGVTEAYLGCMGSCDTWHTSNMGQTFDPEPTQWCRGPQLARFVHSTRFRSRGVLCRGMTLAISIDRDSTLDTYLPRSIIHRDTPTYSKYYEPSESELIRDRYSS
jgi:hypothetical protein